MDYKNILLQNLLEQVRNDFSDIKFSAIYLIENDEYRIKAEINNKSENIKNIMEFNRKLSLDSIRDEIEKVLFISNKVDIHKMSFIKSFNNNSGFIIFIKDEEINLFSKEEIKLIDMIISIIEYNIKEYEKINFDIVSSKYDFVFSKIQENRKIYDKYSHNIRNYFQNLIFILGYTKLSNKNITEEIYTRILKKIDSVDKIAKDFLFKLDIQQRNELYTKLLKEKSHQITFEQLKKYDSLVGVNIDFLDDLSKENDSFLIYRYNKIIETKKTVQNIFINIPFFRKHKFTLVLSFSEEKLKKYSKYTKIIMINKIKMFYLKELQKFTLNYINEGQKIVVYNYKGLTEFYESHIYPLLEEFACITFFSEKNNELWNINIQNIKNGLDSIKIRSTSSFK